MSTLCKHNYTPFCPKYGADCISRCSRNFHSYIKKRPLHNVKGEDSAVPPYFIHFLNPEQSAPVGNIPLESCNVDHSGTAYPHPASTAVVCRAYRANTLQPSGSKATFHCPFPKPPFSLRAVLSDGSNSVLLFLVTFVTIVLTKN